MRFTAVAGVVMLSLLGVHCGGGDDDGSGGDDPAAAAADFTSPPGTISNENATTLMNDALDASNVSSVVGGLTRSSPDARAMLKQRSRGELTRALNDEFDDQCYLDAVSGSDDGTSGSIDMEKFAECAGCTGTGSIDFEFEDDQQVSGTTTFNNVSYECDANAVPYTCDGTVSYDTVDSVEITCYQDFTCTYGEDSQTVDECFASSGDILVDDGSGENVVCEAITPNADCTSVCSDWEDVTGSVKIECSVPASDQTVGCTASDISEFTDCTVASGECVL